jgi:hypothetical protein
MYCFDDGVKKLTDPFSVAITVSAGSNLLASPVLY